MTEGPGGVERGRVNIRAVPDSSHFRRDLVEQLNRIEETTSVTVGARVDATSLRREVDRAVTEASVTAKRVTIKTNVDSSQLDGFTRAVQRADKSLARHSTGGSSRAGLWLKLGAAASLAAPGVLALAGSLEKVAGAGLLLPGLFGAAGVGVASLVVGFQGLGDALKNSGDPEKYAAALAGLSPSARKAAVALQGLGEQAHTLRLNVQEHLFSGLSTQLSRLGATYLPAVSAGLGKVASEANAAAKQFFSFASSGQTLRDTQTALDNTATGFHNLVPAVKPFASALRDIGTVGSSFLPGLASSLATVTTRFGAFITQARETGKLAGWMQGGIDAVRELGSVLGSSLSIVQGFIRAASNAGGGVLGGLADTLKSVANVVNSPTFQAGLTEFFKGLQGGFTALTKAMPSLGKALAALGPPLGALATGAGQVLAHTIDALTPAIVTLAPAVTELVTAFTKLATGAIDAVAPVLNDIAGAARFIIHDVPGATIAISALLLALGGRSIAGALGLGGALTKLATSMRALSGASLALGSFTTLKAGMNDAQVAASAFSGRMGSLGGMLGKAKSALAGLGLTLPVLGGAAVAVGAAFYAVQLRVDAMRKAHDSATEAAAHLKSAIDANKKSMFDFSDANRNAVKELRSLDKANQKAYLIQIGVELVTTDGMTPKQAFAALKRLAESAGIELPVGLNPETLTNVKAQLDAVATTGARVVREMDVDPFGTWQFGASATKETMDSIAQAAVNAFKADNFAGGIAQINAFEQAVKSSGGSLDAQRTALDYTNDAVLRLGKFTGVSTDNTNTLRDTLGELTRAAAGVPQPLRDYSQAVLDASNGSDDLTAAIAKVNAEQPGLAAAAGASAAKMDTQKYAAQQLTVSLDALAAAVLRAVGGDIAVKQAQADALAAAGALGAALKANGSTLDETTVKGRANIGAVNTLVNSYKSAVSATIDWAKTHKDAAARVNQDLEALRQKLIAQMVQAGATRAEAAKLADTYTKMPKKVTTGAVLETKKAEQALTNYQEIVNNRFGIIAKDASSAGKDIGQNLGGGLTAGLRAEMNAAIAQGAMYARSVALAMKQAAKIKSPSRVTMEIGQQMGQGLIVGLGGMVSAAVTAGGVIARAAVTAMSKSGIAALRAVTMSLKAQPSSVNELRVSYGGLRATMLKAADAQGATSARLVAAKKHTADLQTQLREYTRTQGLSTLASNAATASARRYFQTQLAAARLAGNKSAIKTYVADLQRLGAAHTSTAAAARAAAAVTKAALNAQIDGAKRAQATAKEAADKARKSYQDALNASKDSARALIDAVQSQADSLTSAINDFRTQITDAIQGGALDLSEMWGAVTQQVGDSSIFVPGSVAQLQASLDARLASVRQFADDLKRLAESGASQDLLSQVAGMGPGSGDILAQQLLAGGPEAIAAIGKVMQEIADTAGNGAQALTDQFFQPGVDAINELIAGLRKQFPELRAALKVITDEVARALSGASAATASGIADIVKNGMPQSAIPKLAIAKAVTQPAALNTALITSGLTLPAGATIGGDSGDIVAAIERNTAATLAVKAEVGNTTAKQIAASRSGATKR